MKNMLKMEENFAAVECLICFYINMKHVLKTKQMIERVFLEQMIKHCEETGFTYSGEEIKTTWKNLVANYIRLKKNGTVEERENCKYFEILDSCYEQSDFHNGVYPKFSDEMVWFLIECFIKRRALEKIHKRNSIVSDIHKEFLHGGYLYITKQDIENKWKYLNIKYEKLKNDPVSLEKFSYLKALQGFHNDSERSTVQMMFTRELTEILIERFTEKKVTCVIHGYDSEQVLSEIQAEFKDLGFYFSKTSIKEKWRQLINIFKFLMAKGKMDTSWVYFNAMKDHFKDDFLSSSVKVQSAKVVNDDVSKPMRLRKRSKSVGLDFLKKNVNSPMLIVKLEKEKCLNPKIKAKSSEKKRSSKKKSSKRPVENNGKSPGRKKTKPSLNNSLDSSHLMEDCNDNKTRSDTPELKDFQRQQHLNKLIISHNQERRSSADLASPTSKVHIINIDHTDIDRNNGNLTINLPSITKQFSDNEFLPLKKRLRIDEKQDDTSKEIEDGFLGFSTSEISQTQERSTNEDKRLTEEEMEQIMSRINTEELVNNKSNCEKSTSRYSNEEFNNFQNVYDNFKQQSLLVPKEEHRESMAIQNYASSNAMAQAPMLLLVIKVDGSNSPKDALSDNVTIKTDGGKNAGNKSDSIEQPSSSTTHVFNEHVKPVSQKSKAITENEGNCNSVEVRTAHSDVSAILPKNESDFVLLNGEQTINDDLRFDNGEVCTVGENVTVHTTEENHCNDNVQRNEKKSEDVFRAPLAVIDKSRLKPLDKNSVPSMFQAGKNLTCTGKIKLPVKADGKLKEILISPRDLSKISKFKMPNAPQKVIQPNSGVPVESTPSQIKFVSQIVKPATDITNGEIQFDNKSKFDANLDDISMDDSASVTSLKSGSRFFFSHKNRKNEEFENESIMSEAVGDDDGLKDNLLATVIDFQEQNNQEFIEIKNLMKQNNLLQRETNKLLRLMLEKRIRNKFRICFYN